LALKEDLQDAVKKILRDQWTTRDGEVVPEPEDLALGNDAVKLDATVLYADMSGSTKLVDNYKPWFAAEVYKAYMVCAARIIKDEGGCVTAYDGDRIMAVFIGDLKNTTAAKASVARTCSAGPRLFVGDWGRTAPMNRGATPAECEALKCGSLLPLSVRPACWLCLPAYRQRMPRTDLYAAH